MFLLHFKFLPKHHSNSLICPKNISHEGNICFHVSGVYKDLSLLRPTSACFIFPLLGGGPKKMANISRAYSVLFKSPSATILQGCNFHTAQSANSFFPYKSDCVRYRIPQALTASPLTPNCTMLIKFAHSLCFLNFSSTCAELAELYLQLLCTLNSLSTRGAVSVKAKVRQCNITSWKYPLAMGFEKNEFT